MNLHEVCVVVTRYTYLVGEQALRCLTLCQRNTDEALLVPVFILTYVFKDSLNKSFSQF